MSPDPGASSASVGPGDLLVLCSTGEPSSLVAGVLTALDAVAEDGQVQVVLGVGGGALARWEEHGRRVVVAQGADRGSVAGLHDRVLARVGRVDEAVERRRQRLVPDRPHVLVVGALAFPLVAAWAPPQATVTVLAGPDDFSFDHPTLLSADDRTRMLAQVDRYLVTTASTAGRMVRQFGVAHDRIARWWEPVATAAPVGPEELEGAPIDAPVVASYGPLSWEAGHDLFVRLAWAVRRTHPAVHWVWAGDQPDERERWKLDFEVEHLGLTDHLHLVPASSQASVLERADVVALTRREDVEERAHLPAAAAGRPIVALRSRSADRWGPDPTAGFVGGDAGAVVPFPDVEELAVSLVQLLDDDAARRRAGEASARRYAERHDPARAAQALLVELAVAAGG